ncbi:hypothetical protein HMJ29_04255 [Hymenobacter taeanensis]|uniref:Uncharacterized protein n=1 Tax=Hymenobacter taeanensis TaxID=2735321 RepID=A0A6M6BDY5_9BACT|nr:MULTISPECIES: hypothetical protein [Hymenobacter]QJX46190.1 hypothetical protein HMJ29_04255 [Hymenobacter taeanensis]UOQ80046.1 hypothetical protein MUN83_14520 [Hymenobacter sp. 5414T-23]
MPKLLLLILWCITLPCIGQTHQLSSFKEIAPPEPLSKPWVELNNHGTGVAVKIINDHLVLHTSREVNTTTLIIAEGTFQGKDRGEWGGELLFTAKKAKPVLVKAGNVRFLFQAKGHVYFIEGLAHMGLTRGALYQLTGEAPHFDYVKLLDFNDSPEAFTFLGEDILIAQSRGFTILHNLQPEVVVKNTFWAGLYPNSVAALSEREVYIGIRGGYV